MGSVPPIDMGEDHANIGYDGCPSHFCHANLVRHSTSPSPIITLLVKPPLVPNPLLNDLTATPLGPQFQVSHHKGTR